MLIVYKHYKNSILATIVDLFGSAFVLMGGVLLVTGFASIDNVAEGLGWVAGSVIIALLGVLIKKGAKRIAEKKEAKNTTRNATENPSSVMKDNRCPRCGNKYKPNDRFCASCGNKLAYPIINEEKPKKSFKPIIGVLIIIVLVGIGIVVSGKSRMYNKAEKALEAGEYLEAVSQYEEILKKYPDKVDGYLGLTNAYLGLAEKDKNYYEIALDCLVLAEEKGLTDESIDTKQREIEDIIYYYDVIAVGDSYVAEGEIEAAQKTYQQAIDLLAEKADAYMGMIRTYIAQNDKEQALDWLAKDDVVTILSEEEHALLKQAVYLKQINVWMEEKENVLLRDWFLSSEADELMDSVEKYSLNESVEEYTEEGLQVFFCDNQVVPAIDSGVGLIVTKYGAYLGDISGWERNGEGRQFYVDCNDDKETYYLITGTWGDNRVNGEAKYIQYFAPIEDNSRWKLKYEGTFQDNCFDGSFKFTWNSSDTGVSGWATITAEDGTFKCIRESEGRYVYAESYDGTWSKSSEEALKNQYIPEHYLY